MAPDLATVTPAEHRSAAGPASGHELDAAFAEHRRELTGFCYRMLGSGSEAEDAVQETLVRAWRAYDRFEGRASLRSWLYRIANNVCIDMLRSPQRRARPMDLGPSSAAAAATPGEAQPDRAFVLPVHDAAIVDPAADPAEQALVRASIRLAFVAALQHLPARQRSALILCEVLRWSAGEVAELLDTTTASVNSALQRARATLARVQPAEALDDPLDEAQQALLARYVSAFERYDIAELVALLRDDVVLSMPPFPLWLQGPSEVAHWMLHQGIGCRGGRLVATSVNGCAAFGNYRPSGPGRWEPFGLQVIEVAAGRIVGQHNFLYPDRFGDYGLPSHLEA